MENQKKKHHKDEELNKKEECTCEKECLEESPCDCSKENCSCDNEECTCDEKECQETTDNDERELLGKRIKDLEEMLLRSQAELINYKKRKDEETNRILKYSEKDILKGFLPILDNFERAINMDDENLDDEVSKFLEGFKLMYKQIKDLLEQFEVKEIEALDKEFDPALEQAVVMDKNEDKESGVVLEVFQKGYMYKDIVLRTAMVKVNE